MHCGGNRIATSSIKGCRSAVKAGPPIECVRTAALHAPPAGNCTKVVPAGTCMNEIQAAPKLSTRCSIFSRASADDDHWHPPSGSQRVAGWGVWEARSAFDCVRNPTDKSRVRGQPIPIEKVLVWVPATSPQQSQRVRPAGF